jgi:hypothetical protein
MGRGPLVNLNKALFSEVQSPGVSFKTGDKTVLTQDVTDAKILDVITG